MAPELAQRIAIHEAGHVVAAAHSGLTVIDVTVRPNQATKVEEDLSEAASVGVMVATAGVVAESVLHKPETRAEPSGPDDITRYNAWSHWGGELGNRPDQHVAYQSGRDTAEALMNSHQDLVKEVARVIRSAIDGHGHTVSWAQIASDVEVIGAAASCPGCAGKFG